MRLKQFFVAAVMLLATGSMVAQQMPQVPVDKDVRIGHLDNGLTYYIRHNNFPEHVASFYIAQKVGLLMRTTTSVVWLTSWSTWLSMVLSISRAIAFRTISRALVWSMVRI